MGEDRPQKLQGQLEDNCEKEAISSRRVSTNKPFSSSSLKTKNVGLDKNVAEEMPQYCE